MNGVGGDVIKQKEMTMDYEFDQERYERMSRAPYDEYTGEVYYNGKWWPDMGAAYREYDRVQDARVYGEDMRNDARRDEARGL